MDRLNLLRGEAGSSRDLTLDTTSPPSEAFMTANDSSSKYFSLSEDSTFNISPSKDATTTTNTDSDRTVSVDSELISNLSPIPKKSDLDSYKIGKQIEAANILSGGVNIFDDNENSYDGDELVIDDNVIEEDKGNELKLESTELPLEKNMDLEPMLEDTDIPSKDTEVVLQIDGKNVDAIDIGNGLYLYRKAGQEELAAVQIIDDDQQQPSFKFLKVRENIEGNLEVYEEIEIEIPKEVPIKEKNRTEKISHVPLNDTNKVATEPTSNKITDNINKTPVKEPIATNDLGSESDSQTESKTEVNLNGKMMKFTDSRKSPLIGTYTPMTFHSTPNKEGIPLTKTMVDQHLHPSRHSDNVKKTIEVTTDSCRQKLLETPTKNNKEFNESEKVPDETLEHEEKEKIGSESLAIPSKDETVLSESVQTPDNNTICETTTPSEEDNKLVLDNISIDKTMVTSSALVIEKEDKVTENKIDSTPKELDKPTTLHEDKICQDSTIIQKDREFEEIKEIEKSQNINNKDTPIDDIINEIKYNENINGDMVKDVIAVHNDKISTGQKLLQEDTVNTVENKKENTLEEAINLNQKSNAESMEIKNVKNETTNKTKPIQNVVNDIQNHTENVNIECSNNIENKEKSSLESKINITMESENKILGKESIIDTNPIENNTGDSNILTSTKDKELSEGAEINTATKEKAKHIDEICINSLKTVQNKHNPIVHKDPDLNCVKNDDNDKPIAYKDIKEQKEIEISNIDNSKKIKEITTHSNTNKCMLIESVSSKSISKETQPPIPTINKEESESKTIDKTIIDAKREIPKPKVVAPKANNNNISGVPFGKWTEANRQEFLNKIKETKVPSNYPNTKQLKQPNDLNRRDVLKKMDSQRQSVAGSTKINDFGNMSKANSKVETPIFVNKSTVNQPVPQNDTNVTVSIANTTLDQPKPIINKKVQIGKTVNPIPPTKKPQRKEINNQDLIDKTIEGIINRAIIGKTSENKEQKTLNDANTIQGPEMLDDIEKKMSELHGSPLEEKPAKEMTQMIKIDTKNSAKLEIPKKEKITKIPSLVPYRKEEQGLVKDKVAEEISDEEIIEHEPITGDIEVNKQNIKTLPSVKNKSNEPNKEGIITENDFDKFARRNSVTYENCLTVSFDSKEPHSVMQTIVEKEIPIKKLSRNELMLAESKAKSANKHLIKHNAQVNKLSTSIKAANEEDTFSKNYQSKVQIAYQSVMTKRNSECPITIIEDKPVKVVYMDSNMEYMPVQSNIQGQELSPLTKHTSDSSDTIHSASESLDSDILDSPNETKTRDESKHKSKHQRKQVLTPVEEPELELIEPRDLGIEISPKKKRKLDDKNEKIKNLVPKKSYLLNRNLVDEEVPKPHDLMTSTTIESKTTTESFQSHTDTISAIDNLVKAAELIENQAENITASKVSKPSLDNSLNTPIKRGRGRPRKYPLPEQVSDVKAPSPQKKPRLIDAKPTKAYSDSDDSSDGEIIKENWTMGKINENIVCPICNKLFRSENVVFKHVKHCTGPSPNRSDSDQRSPTRRRRSSERKYRDSTSDFTDEDDEKLAKVRSRKARHYYTHEQEDDVIVIEDTPIKEKPQKLKMTEVKKNIDKTKILSNTNNLICEFCGKTFRQLSYLVNHKLQHKKEEQKNSQAEIEKNNFSCEVCKKEFRKLHHLVQHRLIHNANPMSPRQQRKSSSEQHESKTSRRQSETKQSDDQSAGFRCEPCDKSFRKLHHLVEHRETHDGISKKGTSHIQNNDASKSSQAYQCEVCKKTYRKLQDFLEHKEQHLETSSEKSDDKSVKSSLSAKDIIHECSLCYMVFPNEHSLNKHTIICLRKKKQSAAKQAAKKNEQEESVDTDENKLDETLSQDMVPNKHCQQTIEDDETIREQNDSVTLHNAEENAEKSESVIEKDELNKKRANSESKSIDKLISDKDSNEEHKLTKTNPNVGSEKIDKVDIKIKEYITIPDTPTPKKKLPTKEKIAPTVTKRHKTLNVTMPVVDIAKPSVESSDDDEVRYMLNPNYKDEESTEVKIFMKVRAKKRNSLQIERPNSKDLIKRRISLQHPPKIPRLKVKAVEPRPLNSLAVEKKLKFSKPEPVPNTDSDDSDVKYSFPVDNSSESNIPDRKSKKHSIAVKRKSLSGIAKRKSIGKHKLASPLNKIKKRTKEIEHRCDCGQLFSSAALLSRHTTLAHTPPRIRRRRSPPPDITAPTKDKQPSPNKTRTNKTKPIVPAKKPKNDVTISNTTASKARKSSVNNSDAKVASSSSKTTDSAKIVSEPIGKVLRSAAHRGVPVPEKMRKLMEKSKK